jgi:hypothetical protein
MPAVRQSARQSGKTAHVIAEAEAAIAKSKEALEKHKETMAVASEQLQGKNRTLHPGEAKPMVTAEEYAQGRAVLDALPDGVYLKCSKCRRWWINSDVTYATHHGVSLYLCERCA